MPTVQDVLKKKGNAVFTVTVETTVLEAARMMNNHHCGATCVVDGEKLIGMFTERDVLNRVVAQGLDPAATRIADVMSSPVVSCGPDAKVADCGAVMSARKIRHLPVLDQPGSEGKLIGMISTGDLMALEGAEKQAHIDHLHEYLHGRT
jgi:CBS domain-containing protein